ncbi:MAG: HIT domain-containing protein [Candidatus Binatia bacterium]
MRVLWAPWRLSYVSRPEAESGCIFCDKPRETTREGRRDNLVLRVTEHAAVMMNLFPYANAHVLVSPRGHSADFASLDGRTLAELQSELQSVVRALTRAFAPGGFNIGLNLGRAGGAGIADHLHWHVVPRWIGDTNFMPMLADTRVMPDHLANTYDRLLPYFEDERR